MSVTTMSRTSQEALAAWMAGEDLPVYPDRVEFDVPFRFLREHAEHDNKWTGCPACRYMAQWRVHIRRLTLEQGLPSWVTLATPYDGVRQ